MQDVHFHLKQKTVRVATLLMMELEGVLLLHLLCTPI